MNITYISEEIEQKILSSLINHNKIFYNLNNLIKSDYFGIGLHRDIFDKISELISNGRSVDYFVLREIFKEDAEYIKSLQLADISLVNIKDYCELLKDKWIKRNLTDLFLSLEKRIDVDFGEDLLKEINQSAFNLSTNNMDCIYNINDFSAENLREAEEFFKDGYDKSKIRTGFRDIDKFIGGYGRTELDIIAARSSMGKTSFGLQSAYYISKHTPVYFMSLEMSAKSLNKRLIQLISETSLYNQNNFNDNIKSSRIMEESKLYINDKTRHDINSIRNSIRSMVIKYKIEIAFIDYIGLIEGTGAYKGSRAYEMQDITKGLKEIAKELNIPIVALAQLNRGTEDRVDCLPMLSDLRDSGSIEQDADIVAMIHRPEYYLEKKLPSFGELSKKQQELREQLEQCRGMADFIIQKNRNGKTGSVRLKFINDYTKFMCLENNYEL